MNEKVERISSAKLLFSLLERSLIHRFFEMEGDRCYNILENMISIVMMDTLDDYEKVIFKDANSFDTKYIFRVNSDFQYGILKNAGEYLELEIYLVGDYKQIIHFSKF